MKQRVKLFLVFLFLFAFVGYLREFFFVHLNIIMYSKYYNSPPTRPLPAIMQPFDAFSYAALYYSKYIYTVLFAVLYFFLNRITIAKLTKNAVLIKTLSYSYFIMLGLAALSMIYGYIVNGRLQDDEYTLSRWLMGIIQSPIICLILLASEKLYSKTTSL
jgi:hypothetical protein